MSVVWEPRLPRPRKNKPTILQKDVRPPVTVEAPIVVSPPTDEPKPTALPASEPIPIPSTHTSSECDDSDEDMDDAESPVVIEEPVNNTGLPIELSGLQVAECSGWSYIPYIL